MTNHNAFTQAFMKRPLNDLCSREIEVSVIQQRCVYVNNRRVAGNKPYTSENLSSHSIPTTVRDVLDALTTEELRAYLDEKIAVDAYCAGARNYRDADASKDMEDALAGGRDAG